MCFLDGVLQILYGYVSCLQYRYAIPLPKTDKNGCIILLYKLGIVASNTSLHMAYMLALVIVFEQCLCSCFYFF